jgi:hypothetical protein
MEESFEFRKVIDTLRSCIKEINPLATTPSDESYNLGYYLETQFLRAARELRKNDPKLDEYYTRSRGSIGSSYELPYLLAVFRQLADIAKDPYDYYGRNLSFAGINDETLLYALRELTGNHKATFMIDQSPLPDQE